MKIVKFIYDDHIMWLYIKEKWLIISHNWKLLVKQLESEYNWGVMDYKESCWVKTLNEYMCLEWFYKFIVWSRCSDSSIWKDFYKRWDIKIIEFTT